MDEDPDAATWREYGFKGKPGDVRRIPRQFAPYHLRLDWLMWFLPLGRSLDDWFTAFLVQAARGRPPTLRLLARDPFDGRGAAVGARGLVPLSLHDATRVPRESRPMDARSAATGARTGRLRATWENGRVKLLVAALEAELVAFPPDLAGFDRLVTGPGKLQATYALTRALDCGRLRRDRRRRHRGRDRPAARRDRLRGRRGDPARRHRHRRHRRAARLAAATRVELGRDGVTIATGDHFVDDAEAVAVIRPLGAGLVDMETYAYAWVAAQFGVPIRVLKSVSDRAQDDAITDWRTTVTACSAQLRERFLAEYGV